MPNVIGMTEEEAKNAVKAITGKDPTTTHDFNSAPSGTVIEQDVPEGETILPNQIISLKVSKGPEPAPNEQEGWNTVPSFTGLTVENAEKTAQKLELKIRVEDNYVNDDNVRYGSICQQDPVAGTKLPPGSEVVVTLSAGPRIVRYTITVSCGTGGTVSPSGTQTVEAGKSKSFAITPDEGYEIDSMLIDGEPVTPSVYYQFSDVDRNHTLSVTFRQSESLIIF